MRLAKPVLSKKLFLFCVWFVFGLLPVGAQANCYAPMCQVNTDWNAQGVWPDADRRFDLRYEFIDRTQLRSGSDDAVAQKLPSTVDETGTRNQNIVASLDYNLGAGLGAHFSLPFTNQAHTHTLNDGAGPIAQKYSFNKIGDIRALGRYQLELGDRGSAGHAGFMAGFKLPTGKININNAAERSLQPSSGTTDLMLGGFYRLTQPAKHHSWFAQLQLQSAMNEREGFKPGRKLNLDAGYLRQVAKSLGLMLQFNYRRAESDSGSNADAENSGSRILSISPGLSYLWGKDWQIYGFVQKPLQQNVNGVQLTSDWSLVLGLTSDF